jgi:pimeloyl-ACP methyl ester carboxylesterase
VTFAQLAAHQAARVTLPGPLAALACGTGPTVLLIPGYTGSKEDFAPLLDPIAGAGFTAVAIDLPGQYESPGPPDESAYLPAALGQVVADLVGGLAGDGQVIVLGHSYGGLVARSAVLAGARVAGLVLMCSGPGALPDGGRRSTLAHAEPVLRAHGIEAVQRLREQSDLIAGLSPPPPELAAFLRTRFLANTPAALLGMADGLRTEPDRVPELAATLHQTRTPCLVTCGEHDDAWPPAQQRDMATRLNAPFTPIPNAAHSPNTENPTALLTLLLPWLHHLPLSRRVRRFM